MMIMTEMKENDELMVMTEMEKNGDDDDNNGSNMVKMLTVATIFS